MAAPDPRDPDVVFGSARTNVSRYDRRTGQPSQVGPDAAARGDAFGRNVRTLLDQDAAPGAFVANWDGRDESGVRLSRGLYFVRLVAGSQVSQKKVTLQ